MAAKKEEVVASTSEIKEELVAVTFPAVKLVNNTKGVREVAFVEIESTIMTSPEGKQSTINTPITRVISLIPNQETAITEEQLEKIKSNPIFGHWIAVGEIVVKK